MLRSSDDDAATHFWNLDGGPQIVSRMVARLHLADSAPPPASHRDPEHGDPVAADAVTVST